MAGEGGRDESTRGARGKAAGGRRESAAAGDKEAVEEDIIKPHHTITESASGDLTVMDEFLSRVLGNRVSGRAGSSKN